MTIAIKNKIKITGRINWKDEFRVTENGIGIQKICLGQKKTKSENEWSSFFVTFFDTKTKETASEVCEFLNVGDYIEVTGRIREEKFIPKGWENLKDEKGNQKTVSQISLIGTSFKCVIWNEENETYDILEG